MCAQVRETDIDTLERCCAAMAYGDLQAEEPGSLSETNFLRLFRLAQLTVEYILHIQDRLVWENGLLKVLSSLCPWELALMGPFLALDTHVHAVIRVKHQTASLLKVPLLLHI